MASQDEAWAPPSSCSVSTAGGHHVDLYGTYADAAFLPPRLGDSFGLVMSDPLNPEDIDNYQVTERAGLLLYGARWNHHNTSWTRVFLDTIGEPFFLPTNAGEHKYNRLRDRCRHPRGFFPPTSTPRSIEIDSATLSSSPMAAIPC